MEDVMTDDEIAKLVDDKIAEALDVAAPRNEAGPADPQCDRRPIWRLAQVL
jgi:hypothetical protein